MSKIDYQKLREIAEKTKIAGEAPVMPFDQRINALNDFMKHFSPDIALALLDELERNQQYIKRRDQENEDIALTVGRLRVELEAAEKRIAELSASHSKLRDTMAGIHNTIRMDGGYTPLAAILNAAKRAYEESASDAGIKEESE
ncbi:ead/Ea22-like family protein [Escherichia coli]|nr:ead/Ea22-like family protein [Escherichia coli]MCO4928807.1 ead/Ea22-like family protein [Escherichia coli]